MNKRILIFSTAYYPHVGGAEVAVKEITGRITDFEFDMIAAKLEKGLPKKEKIGNVNLYRIGFGNPLIDKYFLAFFGHRLAQKLHKKNNYAFLWSVMASYNGFAAAKFKKKNLSVPFLLTLQEGDDPDYIRRRVGKMYNKFKEIFSLADYAQAISKFLVSWGQGHGLKCKVQVVPNAVDIKKFIQNDVFDREFFRKEIGIEKDEKIVITTSRLALKNGVADLINGFSKYNNDNAKSKLLILGVGELERELKKLVNEIGKNDFIKFLGLIDHEILPKYLWASDCFCRPSLSEGLGNSFLEAMVANVPVIATPVGGIPDFLFDKQTGFFCEPNKPETIYENLKFVFDEKNKTLIEGVKKTAQKMVIEKYNWDRVAREMNNIFQNIINGNSSKNS